MLSIKDQVRQIIKEVLKIEISELTSPPNPAMGDLALPCFGLTKDEQKNPVEIAKDVVVRLEGQDLGIIERVVAAGPYVNFYLKTPEVGTIILEEVEKAGQKYGNSKLGKGQKVMIEYSQPNTHKEFHIGHLRNVCIGSTMVNLFTTQGYKTISANYIGDIGAHVAKCLWYIHEVRHDEGLDEMRQSDNKIRGRWLGEMYIAATKMLDEDEQLKEQVEIVQQKLEHEDGEYLALWEETREWSMEYFKRIYKTLGVEFQEWFFESEVEKPGKGFVQELVKKNIAKKGDGGAIIVDLQAYGLDIFLILKSDGNTLYATKDLALAHKKFEDFKIDKSIYIVDNRQHFYFQQLFKTLELIGWHKEMFFLGYEFVTLPEGAMSSRTGNVVLFDDLYHEVLALLTEETKKRHSDWNEKKVEVISSTLTHAALKFDMLKHPTDKRIVFNKEEATAFEGFSAPYILYVVARINSLIKKAKIKYKKSKINFSFLKEKEEKKLLLLIADYPEVTKKALENYNPSVVARYCFDLSQSFNEFYNKHQILNVEESLMNVRLALCDAVRCVLTCALHLLSIEAVDEM